MSLNKSKFHFVGIGGIGMCGLAELLHNIGARVTGSDLSENANTEHLKSLGVKIHIGHRAENVSDADVVVYSSAVQDSNPEIQQARSQQIPLIPRAEALAEMMRLKRGIALAGTHGKTTTTSMTAAIFLAAELKPTIVVGGRLDLIQSTALLGQGEWLIAEADESDGSFHKLSPEIAVITNIDNDHLDYYKSFDDLEKSFLNFGLKVPFYGALIVCGDDSKIRRVFQNYPKRVIYYGFDEKNDYYLKGEKGRYKVYHQDKCLGDMELHVPGSHNALNALASLIVGLKAGISFETCKKGLLKYQGVDRRFHFRGEKNGIKYYDDYGHHPTEVRATLQAFREKFPNNKIRVLFQPHRYSRTELCWHEFTQCFNSADSVFITDIYAAGEKAIPGIDSSRLCSEVKHADVQYVAKAEAKAFLQKKLQKDDVLVCLGAGDIWKIGVEVLEGK